MRILGLLGWVSAFLLGVVGLGSCVNPTGFGWIAATRLVTKRIFTQLGICGELRETIVRGNAIKTQQGTYEPKDFLLLANVNEHQIQ